MKSKLRNLQKTLSGMRSVLVAYSGGVDSTFLLKVAHDVLGKKVVAVTALSPTYPRTEMGVAKEMAEALGVRHAAVVTDELSNPIFTGNPVDRCYWCKKELFSKLTVLAEELGLKHVLDGSNRDDTNDFRPGMRAAKEFGVRSPLMEAGLGKEEIRRLSKEMGIKTWDKPALACLASRFPHGTEITVERMSLIDEAEGFLRGLGITQVRVRHHGDIARIEVRVDEMGRLTRKGARRKMIRKLRGLGYRYVTVDVEGYRTGSMNPIDTPERKQQPSA